MCACKLDLTPLNTRSNSMGSRVTYSKMTNRKVWEDCTLRLLCLGR